MFTNSQAHPLVLLPMISASALFSGDQCVPKKRCHWQCSKKLPLAVQYYEDAGHNMWSLEDPQYHIDQGLAHPTWATKGSRLLYIFNV